MLTLLTAWWLDRLAGVVDHHLVSANPEKIRELVPPLADATSDWARRSLLVKRTRPMPVECVVRGYLSGSAWREYEEQGTLAGEPLRPDLTESEELRPAIFSPATKVDDGHDENIPFAGVIDLLGKTRADRLRELSLQIYEFGRTEAARRGILLADTKFEFGETDEGRLLLIDEVLTPDSSRYWPAESWRLGVTPLSLDKQPIRDWLFALPDWDRRPPPPDLDRGVVEAATARYLEIFRRLTGIELDEYVPPSFADKAGTK